MMINGQFGGGFKAAGWFRDRMVMPDGLVRNQRSEPTVAAVW